MKLGRLLLALGVAIAFASSASATVTINEIRIDQPGGDSDEYFELAGVPGESLDGLWYITIGDDGGDGSGNPASRSGSVESVTDLTGLSIPGDGYFLATESTFGTGTSPFVGIVPDLVTSLNFENSENHTHMLVSGFTGAAGDLIDTNRDGFIDIFPWTSILDAVSLIEKPNGPGHTPPSASEFDEWDYSEDASLGSAPIGPDGPYEPGHVYRGLAKSKTGPWAIGNFVDALGLGPDDSPGTTNIPEPATVALLALGGLAVLRRR